MNNLVCELGKKNNNNIAAGPLHVERRLAVSTVFLESRSSNVNRLCTAMKSMNPCAYVPEKERNDRVDFPTAILRANFSKKPITLLKTVIFLPS